ncbi:MAG: Nramp family divalent metal transporter [Sciscionella sp.]|nr:Nramp family divalent metal transporter [Sciscionella sp.]
MRLRAQTALFGPAFVAAIAYVDPGNVASNSQAGARYGYLLVWVVLLANLVAGQVQYLSAKLGLVTGMSLPQALRERMTTPIRIAYWAQAELVSMATDVAEVIGGALALSMLFGVPMVYGGLITGVVSMLLLNVQNAGQRQFERLVSWLLLVIAVGFVAGLFVAPPSAGGLARGLVPSFVDGGSVLIATSMLGATVMPHAIYLHSALARDRHGKPTGARLTGLLRTTRYDVSSAMAFAGGVNLCMVLLAATVLRGHGGVDSIIGVHDVLSHDLGAAIGLAFAIGLLASGLASTSVGCYAGAVVIEGLLRRRIPLLVRRVVTLLPALGLLAMGVNPTMALILSQVVLSFGVPFALIPLVRLTGSRAVMGEHVNRRRTTVLAALSAGLIVLLNLALIGLTVAGGA